MSEHAQIPILMRKLIFLWVSIKRQIRRHLIRDNEGVTFLDGEFGEFQSFFVQLHVNYYAQLHVGSGDYVQLHVVLTSCNCT